MPSKAQATTTFDQNHNGSRRQLLKFAAGLTGYCLTTQAQGSAFASVNYGISQSADKQHTDVQRNARHGRIEFRFVDSKSVPGLISLGQGTVVNHTANDLLINSIAPRILTTDNGSYDIAAYLTEHPISLASGQRHHFWVRPQPSELAYGRNTKMYGSLTRPDARHEPVLAHIDHPGIGVAAKVQPVELVVTTATT